MIQKYKYIYIANGLSEFIRGTAGLDLERLFQLKMIP